MAEPYRERRAEFLAAGKLTPFRLYNHTQSVQLSDYLALDELDDEPFELVRVPVEKIGWKESPDVRVTTARRLKQSVIDQITTHQ